MFLKLDHVTVKYGAFTAVSDFSLELEEGSFVCLLGPSGCGKSSLLRCLGGFVPEASGAIYLQGERLNQPPEERPIATVFQSYGLFPHMNVEKNICYGLRLRHIPRAEQQQRLNEMLHKLGLDGYAGKRVQELSGGEQQRVALARSLMIQPRLLLLDEPLSNLDAKLRVQLRGELKRIQQDFGISSILVTHDQTEAFELGDKIVLMCKGLKVEEGRPEELYMHPREAFTREFLGESTFDLEGRPLLRPENWEILPGSAETGCPAEVLREVFQGQLLFYDCQPAGSPRPVRALVLNRSDAFRPKLGEKIRLRRREALHSAAQSILSAEGEV